MKKFIITSKKRLLAIFCIAALAITSVGIYVFAAGGSADDPVVSLSYLEKRLSELGSSSADGSGLFKLVEVKKGKKLDCKEGTELILRMGDAVIYSTESGGLANATTGKDLPNGTPCPANSLLIVSRSDGRGLTATTDLLVLVKGGYEIK